MKILIAIAPEKFRDEEYAEPSAALKQAGIGFDVASTRRGTCTGMLGAKVSATLSFEDVDPHAYDGIVIVGGAGAQVHLWDDDLLIHLVKYFHSSGKLVAAICLAPAVLARAGILHGRSATCFPSPAAVTELRKDHAVIEEAPVVTDGNIITGRNPEAAKAFAAAVVTALRAGPSQSAQW